MRLRAGILKRNLLRESLQHLQRNLLFRQLEEDSGGESVRNSSEEGNEGLNEERELGVGVRFGQLKEWVEESAGQENIGGELALLREDGESLSERGAGGEGSVAKVLSQNGGRAGAAAGGIHF